MAESETRDSRGPGRELAGIYILVGFGLFFLTDIVLQSLPVGVWVVSSGPLGLLLVGVAALMAGYALGVRFSRDGRACGLCFGLGFALPTIGLVVHVGGLAPTLEWMLTSKQSPGLANLVCLFPLTLGCVVAVLTRSVGPRTSGTSGSGCL